MGVISGVEGFVNIGGAAAERIANWTVDKTADVQMKYASNTSGAPIAVAGNYDWSGSYEAFGAIPEVQPGASFTFKGIFEPTSDKGVESDENGTICDRVEIVWDQEGGSLIRHTCNFSANGALTAGTITTPPEDSSTPEAETSSGCLVKISNPLADPSWSELENVRGVRLSLMRDNKLYHASTTGQAPKRVMGNLSGELAIDLYISDPTGVEWYVNAAKYVQLYTAAATYWQLYGIMFTGVTGIGAPRETSDLIAVTLNGVFSGHNDISGTLTKGEITDPASGDWWS